LGCWGEKRKEYSAEKFAITAHKFGKQQMAMKENTGQLDNQKEKMLAYLPRHGFKTLQD